MNAFPVSVRFPVQWGEMDAFGHVNNARFLAWFEAARIAYLERVGLWSQQAGTGLGVGPILASAQVDYLRPVLFPATLEVGARVGRLGNTSFLMEYAVEDAQTGAAYARGSTTIVTVRYPTYEKVPLPPALREAIQGLEGGRSLDAPKPR
ncbi:acyl-CoA thioesterase [Aggregicoccus sp. 17bor-14]|uniref:acyl-CoA thioesterase n=1 Tax=Myxococcaceae TaxID=31 RepID=UPI00129C1AE4|nr:MULTISPECIES: thioesterase family protein [Myxococcaceae]MBF5043058.1 acyl-CoA thioesterase [Simulacricoccus sp. 17bor-14]MRI88821.1 acyl-CoA thioesterase [Aggregicoccus sp. 17bor-14]